MMASEGKDVKTSLRRRRRDVSPVSDEDATDSSLSEDSSMGSWDPTVSTDNKTESLLRRVSSSKSSLVNLTRSASATFTIDDPVQYGNKRQMTILQERANALCMVPCFAYCFYYLTTTAHWVCPDMIEEARSGLNKNGAAAEDVDGCIDSWLLPNMWYLPPPTVLCIGVGIFIHNPASFLYHWKYCTDPTVLDKIDHWARRLDQSLIHLSGALWSYGVSGSPAYFALNLLYNLDCIRCICQKVVKPRRNQCRIFLCAILYTAPLLFMADQSGEDSVTVFLHFWVVMLTGTFLFVSYPIGGWSQALFHLVLLFMPKILMNHATTNSVDWSMAAAKCAAIATS